MNAQAFPIPVPERDRRGHTHVAPIEPSGVDLARVYVWQIPVRITHWVIALSIVVLAATGIYLGNPFIIAAGEARQHFVMGIAKLIHFYAAIAFTLAVLARILWMFVGNRYSHWNKLLPVGKRRFKNILPTVRFYLFMLRKPPGFVGHNPVAGLAYSAIFFLYLTMITSGLALYAISAPAGSPMRWFSAFLPLFGGAQIARLVHHIVMWLLLGFAVHHVYSALLMSHVEKNGTLESIFSGFKTVHREDLIYSGYRFLEPHDPPKPIDGAPHGHG